MKKALLFTVENHTIIFHQSDSIIPVEHSLGHTELLIMRNALQICEL